VVTLTGRNHAYETTPEQSDLVMPTAELNPKEAADRVVELVLEHVLPASRDIG
jgi:adenylylsulfate kinase-like enzyme